VTINFKYNVHIITQTKRKRRRENNVILY